MAPVRKKRQYKRRQKQTQQVHHTHPSAAPSAIHASFGDVDGLHHDMDSSEEDIMSPVSAVISNSVADNQLSKFIFHSQKHLLTQATSDLLSGGERLATHVGGGGSLAHNCVVENYELIIERGWFLSLFRGVHRGPQALSGGQAQLHVDKERSRLGRAWFYNKSYGEEARCFLMNKSPAVLSIYSSLSLDSY